MIPVYKPSLGEYERALMLEAFDSGWISGRGAFIDLFERNFAAYVGAKEAVAVANGSVALDLTLTALGVGHGDEVVLPAYTYVACANSVSHVGATPIFVDAIPATLQVDITQIIGRLTERTKAVMIPHLFGYVSDLRALAQGLASRGIPLIEDCSEALGSRIHGDHAGAVGSASTYSFFGNKTITTGEGGMVTTNDEHLAGLLRRFRNQGISPVDQYFHDLVAFNFRMTNIQAAIGVAQLERIGEFLARKLTIAHRYIELLHDADLEFLQDPPSGSNSRWLCVATLAPGIDRRALISYAALNEVDLRPGFVPMYRLPMYSSDPSQFAGVEDFQTRIICLPSYPDLTDGEVERVASVVRNGIAAARLRAV